jgi:hypothetical protein
MLLLFTSLVSRLDSQANREYVQIDDAHGSFVDWTNRSLIITSLGIILETAGFTLGLFEAINNQISTIVFGFGWPFMVTGFSLVLYSRLHFIVHKPKLIRCLLVIIVVDAMIVQFPVFIFSFIGAPQYLIFIKVAKFLSHFEVIFAVQEVLLSSLYIYFFIRFVKQGGSQGSKNLSRTFHLLIAAEVIIIVCDIVVNILLYLNLYIPRKIVLPFVYAIKLQIEFLVLNRLVNSRRSIDARLQDYEADVNFGNTSPGNSRVITRLGESSGCDSSPSYGPGKEGMKSFGPMCTTSSLDESTRQSAMSGQTMVSVASILHQNAEGIGRGDLDSIEELERRYLGRSRTEEAV